MTLTPRTDGAGPVRPDPIGRRTDAEAQRRSAQAGVLAVGTLACTRCDAPVALPGPLAPGDDLSCPFCGEAGTVRDFLSLAPPVRPARVEVRVAPRARHAA